MQLKMPTPYQAAALPVLPLQHFRMCCTSHVHISTLTATCLTCCFTCCLTCCLT